MTVLQVVILTLVGAGGTAVVLVRDPVRQIVMVSFFGLLLGVLFFVFQAPDVALSQIGVGTVVLPALLLMALAKIRQNEQEAASHNEDDRG